MKKYRAVLTGLICLFIILLCGTSAAAQHIDAYWGMLTVRVGLAYGDNALPAATLSAENGFELGYLDWEDKFVSLAFLASPSLAFAKDRNIYIKDGVLSDEDNGGEAVGSFHLQITDLKFSTFDEAFWKAAEIKEALKSAGYELNVFIAYWGEGFRIRIGEYLSAKAALNKAIPVALAIGENVDVFGDLESTVTVIDLSMNKTVFEAEIAGSWLAARPIQNGGQTTFIKYGANIYRGVFEFKRMTGDDITLISFIGLQEYLMGVVPYEMYNTSPLEALKAQAVCARTYLVRSYNKHIALGFNICGTTDCQTYKGAMLENENVRQSVIQTEGQLVTYAGLPISTYYFASSGGYSENNENVWGGTPLPYYRAVPDEYENLDGVTFGKWCYTATGQELGEYFRSKNHDIGAVVGYNINSYTEPAGNIYSISFYDAEGRTVTAERTANVRTLLSPYVKSARFELKVSVDAYINGEDEARPITQSELYAIGAGGRKTVSQDGPINVLSSDGVQQLEGTLTYTFAGQGWGHSLGLSQSGAEGRARAGHTYIDILKYYYTGVEVESFQSLIAE